MTKDVYEKEKYNFKLRVRLNNSVQFLSHRNSVKQLVLLLKHSVMCHRDRVQLM